jgi:hypothetical protein
MQWAIAYGFLGKFKWCVPQLRELIENSFKGWIQTRVLEQGNKILREAETKDNSSKVLPPPSAAMQCAGR